MDQRAEQGNQVPEMQWPWGKGGPSLWFQSNTKDSPQPWGRAGWAQLVAVLEAPLVSASMTWCYALGDSGWAWVWEGKRPLTWVPIWLSQRPEAYARATEASRQAELPSCAVPVFNSTTVWPREAVTVDTVRLVFLSAYWAIPKGS